MKGLEFVAIDPGIARDTRIAFMAAGLQRDRYWVAGHFPAFFGEVARHQPDGNLSAIPDDLLDEWAGNVEGWGAQVRAHMCDDDGVLRSWMKYNGEKLLALQQDRERKREAREAQRNGRGPSAENPRTRPPQKGRRVAGQSEDSPGNVRGPSTSTVTETDINISAQRARASVERLLTEVRQVATAHAWAFEATLQEHSDPESFVVSIRAMVDGSEGPEAAAIPLSVLAKALADMRANDQPLSMETLRIYAGKAMKPRAVRTTTPAPAAPRPTRATTTVPEL